MKFLCVSHWLSAHEKRYPIVTISGMIHSLHSSIGLKGHVQVFSDTSIRYISMGFRNCKLLLFTQIHIIVKTERDKEWMKGSQIWEINIETRSLSSTNSLSTKFILLHFSISKFYLYSKTVLILSGLFACIDIQTYS